MSNLQILSLQCLGYIISGLWLMTANLLTFQCGLIATLFSLLALHHLTSPNLVHQNTAVKLIDVAGIILLVGFFLSILTISFYFIPLQLVIYYFIYIRLEEFYY